MESISIDVLISLTLVVVPAVPVGGEGGVAQQQQHEQGAEGVPVGAAPLGAAPLRRVGRQAAGRGHGHRDKVIADLGSPAPHRTAPHPAGPRRRLTRDELTIAANYLSSSPPAAAAAYAAAADAAA